MKTMHPSFGTTMPLPGTKILFACFPVDGHFNPLTGLAKYLADNGCDVRWYASKYFTQRIEKLGMPYFLFNKAREVDITHIDEEFPERKKIKGKVGKLNFDLINVFIGRAVEYYEDIQNIHKEFPFEVMIADICFTAIPFVQDKMNIPVVSIGIAPLPQTSKDLAPYGLGMTPSATTMGKWKHRFLRMLADKVLFAKSNKALKDLFEKHNISSENMGVFDVNVRKSTRLLQIGSQSFEYKRSDITDNVKFVGALLPFSKKKEGTWLHEKLSQYKKIILATQGTVEKDTSKLIVPTLEAFKKTDALVIVTTGGSSTEELRKKYAYENIIIEDFIPFADVMPYADVYITNGGYGGVLLSISQELPLVVAGIHEGKNEINARVGYFELGINLNTETPSPLQLRKAVQAILENEKYRSNVKALRAELQQYNPLQLCTQHIQEVLNQHAIHVTQVVKETYSEEII